MHMLITQPFLGLLAVEGNDGNGASPIAWSVTGPLGPSCRGQEPGSGIMTFTSLQPSRRDKLQDLLGKDHQLIYRGPKRLATYQLARRWHRFHVQRCCIGLNCGSARPS